MYTLQFQLVQFFNVPHTDLFVCSLNATAVYEENVQCM